MRSKFRIFQIVRRAVINFTKKKKVKKKRKNSEKCQKKKCKEKKIDAKHSHGGSRKLSWIISKWIFIIFFAVFFLFNFSHSFFSFAHLLFFSFNLIITYDFVFLLSVQFCDLNKLMTFFAWMCGWKKSSSLRYELIDHKHFTD